MIVSYILQKKNMLFSILLINLFSRRTYESSKLINVCLRTKLRFASVIYTKCSGICEIVYDILLLNQSTYSLVLEPAIAFYYKLGNI